MEGRIMIERKEGKEEDGDQRGKIDKLTLKKEKQKKS